MAETLLEFPEPVVAADGTAYIARACGGELPGGTWQGWIEFIPGDGGAPVRSPRETTQPNRADTVYWATGLTPVYLEGALSRALRPATVVQRPLDPPLFDGPAPGVLDEAPEVVRGPSVLDPFSVYEKGEALLAKQLGALSAWHLANIVVAYDLSDEDRATLEGRSAAELVDIIVAGVQRTRRPRARA
jgi:hypothetical protein